MAYDLTFRPDDDGQNDDCIEDDREVLHSPDAHIDIDSNVF